MYVVQMAFPPAPPAPPSSGCFNHCQIEDMGVHFAQTKMLDLEFIYSKLMIIID